MSQPEGQVTGPDDAGSPGETDTGHPEVDDVVGSLQGLADRPVSEHVQAFESAHSRLREVLDRAGEDR